MAFSQRKSSLAGGRIFNHNTPQGSFEVFGRLLAVVRFALFRALFSPEDWQFDSMRRYSGFLGCGVYLPPGYSQSINQTVYVGVENVRAGKFNW